MFNSGQRVIVRAHMAGVYVGEVVTCNDDGTAVTLAAGARQIHYWSAGGSIPQVAERGIRAEGSRVTAPSSAPVPLGVGAQIVQICAMTDVAWDRVQSCPAWSGAL